MNKRQIIASLNKIANELDLTGLHTEANTITRVMVKIADEFREDYQPEPDTRYAPERFKDEVEKMMNSQEFSNVYPSDKKTALMALRGYLTASDKNSYLNDAQDEFMLGETLQPKDKLKLDLMRFAEGFFKEMKLEEMDYKHLDRAVREIM
jgi:hypothetical protein